MTTLRKISDAVSPIALAILRIVAGVILAVHGWLKVIGWQDWVGTIDQLGLPAPEVFAGLALAAELGGGIALILGLLTPLVSLAILVNMIVAIALVHWEHGLLTAEGGFEFPLLLAATALYLFARGPGLYSLDHAFFGRRARRRETLPREPHHRPAHA